MACLNPLLTRTSLSFKDKLVPLDDNSPSPISIDKLWELDPDTPFQSILAALGEKWRRGLVCIHVSLCLTATVSLWFTLPTNLIKWLSISLKAVRQFCACVSPLIRNQLAYGLNCRCIEKLQTDLSFSVDVYLRARLHPNHPFSLITMLRELWLLNFES
jgi:hypothetical protein